MALATAPVNEAARLEALRRYEVLDTPPEPAFDALVKLASRLLRAPIAQVSFIDKNRQWAKASQGLAVIEFPRNRTFCAHVVSTERPFVVEDAFAELKYNDYPLVSGPTEIRFYAGYPLRTKDGFVLGALCVMDRRPRELDADDLEMLRLLSGQTMDQMERRREIRLLAALAEFERGRPAAPPVMVAPPPAQVDAGAYAARPGRAVLESMLEADERDRLIDALRQARGKRDEAGRLLGMSRATFYRRLAACGLTRARGG